MEALLNKAEKALFQLSLASEMVPSIDWFIYGFVRKEAVLSSQIEGTQATLVDLFKYETEIIDRNPDVEEVCNYLDAVNYARQELNNSSGLPISMRLLNQIHARLMNGVRGADKNPGEIRQSQNWIGGTRPGNARFVPPPPHELAKLLTSFEKYIHSDCELPSIIKAGLVHVQFETIHPYLDGNGRIGRLLISILLEHWKLLPYPLLYLSLFFKRHRTEYYDRLSAVRTKGDWEGWVAYFLEAVTTISLEATACARSLFALVNNDRSKLISSENSTIMAIRLFELLPDHPILTTSKTMKLMKTTRPTVNSSISTLINAGILQELTGKKRDREYGYMAYLELLKEENQNI